MGRCRAGCRRTERTGSGEVQGDLPANTILTPHPGEAARLLGLTAPPQEGLDDYTAAPYRLSYPVYYDLEDKYISGVSPPRWPRSRRRSLTA